MLLFCYIKDLVNDFHMATYPQGTYQTFFAYIYFCFRNFYQCVIFNDTLCIFVNILSRNLFLAEHRNIISQKDVITALFM